MDLRSFKSAWVTAACIILFSPLITADVQADGSPLDSMLKSKAKPGLLQTQESKTLEAFQKQKKALKEEALEAAKQTQANEVALYRSIKRYTERRKEYLARSQDEQHPQTLRKAYRQTATIIQYLTLQLEQMQTARMSYRQELQALQGLLDNIIETRASTAAQIKKTYAKTRTLTPLAARLTSLQAQAQRYKKKLSLNQKKQGELKQRLDRLQQLRLALQAKLRTLTPRYADTTPAPKAPSRPQARRATPRRPPPPKGPTHKEPTRLLTPLKLATLARVRFQLELYVVETRLLRQRLRALQLEQQRWLLRTQRDAHLQKLLQQQRRLLIGTSKGGLWYRDPMALELKLFRKTYNRTLALVASLQQGSPKTWWKRLIAAGWLILVGWALAMLALLIGVSWAWVSLRRRQEKLALSTFHKQLTVTEEAEDEMELLIDAGEIELNDRQESALQQPLQQLMHLLLAVIRQQLPLWLLLSFLLSFGWLLKVGPAVWSVLFSWLLWLPLLQLAWTANQQLLTAAPTNPLFQEDEHPEAGVFRRWFDVLIVLFVFAVIVVGSLELLRFPDDFVQLLRIAHMAIVLLICLQLLRRKNALLSLLHAHADNRWLALLTNATNRLYPLVLLTAFGLFGTYAIGYMGLARFVARSLVLTVLVLAVTFGLYRLVELGTLWLFGHHQERGNRLDLDPQWSQPLMQLSRSIAGLLLVLLALSIFLGIWGIGSGFRTVPKAMTYPLLQIQKTQITLWSMLKFVLVLWLTARLIKLVIGLLEEKLYPTLDIEIGNQQAINTTIRFALLFGGLLMALSWVGVGVGILAVFAGVIGIAVGFGTQNIANNFISGLIITYSKHIKVGDFITVGSSTGYVRKITIRNTTLENNEGHIFLLPNAELLTQVVTILPPPAPTMAPAPHDKEASGSPEG